MPLTSMVALCALAFQASPPSKPPYEVLPAPTDTSTLLPRLGGKSHVVYQEGDVLTFLYKGPGKQIQTISVWEPLRRIGETDVWVLQLRMPGWQEAFLTYGFYDAAPSSIPPRIMPEVWRGAQAPPAPAEAKELKGKILQRTIRSQALGENRNLTIYLPPNAPRSGLPAFYMADGAAAESYARILEPLILAGKVRPVAIVGVHNGGYRGDRAKGHDRRQDFRALEYVPGEDLGRFRLHSRFFVDEVADWAARAHGISRRRADRAVLGFSNGAVFAAAIAIARPDAFAHTVPMSVGMPPTSLPKPTRPLPHFHFVAGKLEPSFLWGTTVTHDHVTAWGAPATLDVYTSGHDNEMWQIAFSRIAPKIFPARALR